MSSSMRQKEVQFDKDGRPQSEVMLWLSSPADKDERRRRFDIFLHGLWPSNDTFHAARNPFYDPEEDGSYESFLHQNWEGGHCPWFDDDYDPNEDPSRSTEVWQPKIGEDGIQDEEDIRMVRMARKEQQASSLSLKKHRARYIPAQNYAGAKDSDIDMLRTFPPPKIESDDPESTCASRPGKKEEGDKTSQPLAQAKAQLATGDSPLQGEQQAIKPVVMAKGIVVWQ
ncbi:hypothetical protein EV127DRAFT_476794 [Xylaria flabelliformis]|nr:hypothetical protein EV127DRAFT_476794 [Xylaria flabelliformis]